MARRRSAAAGGSLAAALVLVVVAALQWLGDEVPTPADPLGEAFRERRSDIVVETAGVVDRLLADDRDGSRHQRFILRLPSGQTVLVAHNIDLAPRVPLGRGDPVVLRGEYEWNERGGVLHWTHHDPEGRRPGGWSRLGEQIYR
jgi:hypothetical protein